MSDSTREKVLEAAKELGYVPNKIAGALASQRVNLVGVIVPSLSNLVFPEVLSGISQELEDTGLQPVFGVTNYSPEKEESVLYEMLSWRPSGLIIAGIEHTPAARAMLENAGAPVVEMPHITTHPPPFCCTGQSHHPGHPSQWHFAGCLVSSRPC